MRYLRSMVWLFALCLPVVADAADSPSIVIQEAFVELHSSPGRGYPVREIVERGESLQVIKRRTSWYQVRTQQHHLGWVSATQLHSSLSAAGLAGEPAVLPNFLA